MAISFPHKSKEELSEHYNCVALLIFCIPVYTVIHIDEDGDAFLPFGEGGLVFPPMEEANWVPRPLLHIGLTIAGAWLGLTSAFNRQKFPLTPISVF